MLESGVSDVIIEGLNIDGQSELKTEAYGILVYGQNITNILIANNNIHHLYVDNGNAHGIAVYGIGATEATAIKTVIIEGNDVHDMKTGSSESIVINGNVKNWEIKGNVLSNLNNIAIDAIGGEGISPTTTLADGRIVPSAVDAARYGFIENNTVSYMSTETNSAYGNEKSWAAAIYVDGAQHIQIANNAVNDVPWAYVVGAENCTTSQHITVQNNVSENTWFGDALFGGYSTIGYLDDTAILCDPMASVDSNEGHGYVKNITVSGNNFMNISSNPNTQLENITLEYRLRNSIFNQPGVMPINTDGNVSGDANSIRSE